MAHGRGRGEKGGGAGEDKTPLTAPTMSRSYPPFCPPPHPPHEYAKRVDVHRRVDLLVADECLGGHVRRCATRVEGKGATALIVLHPAGAAAGAARGTCGCSGVAAAAVAHLPQEQPLPQSSCSSCSSSSTFAPGAAPATHTHTHTWIAQNLTP